LCELTKGQNVHKSPSAVIQCHWRYDCVALKHCRPLMLIDRWIVSGTGDHISAILTLSHWKLTILLSNVVVMSFIISLVFSIICTCCSGISIYDDDCSSVFNKIHWYVKVKWWWLLGMWFTAPRSHYPISHCDRSHSWLNSPGNRCSQFCSYTHVRCVYSVWSPLLTGWPQYCTMGTI